MKIVWLFEAPFFQGLLFWMGSNKKVCNLIPCKITLPSSHTRPTIPTWPLPAVRELTRDGRLSTYNESVLKLSKVLFKGKWARTGHPLKLPSPTKLARLGHFPPASQACRLAGPVIYNISVLCSCVQPPPPPHNAWESYLSPSVAGRQHLQHSALS